jgi:hypothetical protein
MSDGGKIFTWTGGRESILLPGTASTTTSVIGTTAISTTSFQGVGDLELGCNVQLVTNNAGIITTVKPMADSLGVWQLSRCAEVFGAK